ncbi:hypothetical protein GOV03_01400 [Candidatus Woesearchaeota archaeon]|nr:hypothetical protein [Candidatus Woesearchaeota archaeon]
MGGRGVKKFIKKSLLFLALGSCIGLSGYRLGQCSIYNQEIRPRHTREEIEEIVQSRNNPRFSFETVRDSIVFPLDSLKYRHYPGKSTTFDRWYSMQESLTLGHGVCIDGAIFFVALLSDNPEYEAKVVTLESETNGHAIAIYKENDSWHYVSFNTPKGLVNNSYFSYESFETPQELLLQRYPYHDKYLILDFNPETLKFGQGISGTLEEMIRSFDWELIKPTKNE